MPYECRRTSCDAFDVFFSAESKCSVSFRLMKIPLTSNKDPQNVANLFKLKVELEDCSVCYITGNTEILHL